MLVFFLKRVGILICPFFISMFTVLGVDLIWMTFGAIIALISLDVARYLIEHGGSGRSADGRADRPGQAGPVPGGLERACQKIASDYGLTAREGDVLRLLGRGRTARHIAGELGMGCQTPRSRRISPTSIASSVSTRSRACSTSSRSMWGGAEKSGARAQLARAGCGLEAIAVIAMAAIAMPADARQRRICTFALANSCKSVAWMPRVCYQPTAVGHRLTAGAHRAWALDMGRHAPATSRAPLARFCLAGLQRLQVVHCVGAGEATRGEGPAKGHAARTGHRGRGWSRSRRPSRCRRRTGRRPWCRRAAAR